MKTNLRPKVRSPSCCDCSLSINAHVHCIFFKSPQLWQLHTIVVEEDGKLIQDDCWGYCEAQCLVQSGDKEDKPLDMSN